MTVRAEDASEQAPKRLTDRGRLMVGGRISGGWSNDTREGWGAYNRWWVSLHPSATYFVRDRVGVGAWAGGGTGRGRLRSVSEASVGFQGLFDVRLGPRVSLFVQPFAGYQYELSSAVGQVLRTDALLAFDEIQIKRHYVRLGTDLPLVFHVSDSVAIGLGPQVTLDIFVKEDTKPDVVSGASAYSGASNWRVITGVSSFIGASF